MKSKLILTILLLVSSLCSTAWSAPITTYVAEFSVIGYDKQEDVKTVIQALLLSRLASEKITTVSKPGGADIRVSGSYIVSGSLFSLDAVAVNSSGVVVSRAYVQGKNTDEIIYSVGTLAKALASGIEKEVPTVAATLSTKTVPANIKPELPASPEKGHIYQKVDSVVSGSAAGAPPAATVQNDIIKLTRPAAIQGLKIHTMDGALSGMALGRTLPGGERELFVIGSRSLRYYLQGAELKLIASIAYKTYEKLLSVDSADLDSNGIPEIYVTVMNSEKLISQVWTVDGNALKKIAGPLPYYFRTVTGSGGVKKLYAQQISDQSDFSGEVAELVKSGESYQLKSPLKLPKDGYLYNFNVLTTAKGVLNPILIDRKGRLRVFNSAGDEFWKSSAEHGGSEAYFERSNLANLQSSGSDYRKVFLEQRVIVTADGDLFVPQNLASWLMLGKHSYSKSSLYCYSWNGIDLLEKWKTRESDNYLADYGYDEATRELLLLEVVSKEEGILDKGASRLVIRMVE